MDRLYDTVFVRPPASSYYKCVSTNPNRTEIDVTLAKEQHRQYASTLKEAGINVIELPPLEGCPDSVFMQDPAILGSHRAVIGRFGESARRGEEKALVEELRDHSDMVGKIYVVHDPGTLEGGDVVITDRGLFVGESGRTNSSGIRQLASHLNDLIVSAVKTELLHLLCGCAYLSEGKMIMAPDLVDPKSFSGFRFVTLPAEETYAADALYLGEGKVLIPFGFPTANRKLKEAGYTPVEVEMSEFYKGDGGVTCLCSPVYRIL